MAKSIIALDTDQIKRYVFATGTLKEIRGASAILDELNRETMETIIQRHDPGYVHADHYIYANGGSGKFIVDSAHVVKILEEVQRIYRETTMTASLTGEQIELPDGWKWADPSQELVTRLEAQLRIAKDQNSEFQTAGSYPLFKDCESCGAEYAQEPTRSPDGKEIFLCPSCFKKRDKSADIKTMIAVLSQNHSKIDPHSPKLWHRILYFMKDQLQERPLSPPEDFNELGNLSTPSNYMGLIYADGNNMGRALERLSTLPEIKAFANTVDNAMYTAVGKVVSQKEYLFPEQNDPEQTPPKQNHQILPFDILLLGGDDLVMVTTAQKAIKTALKIAEEFHVRTNGLTLSVSVILAHAKFPFRMFLALAESALKAAKKGLAELEQTSSQPPITGMFNFMVVNSSNALDFNDIKRDEWQHKAAKEVLYRTLRPYSLENMRQLYQCVQNYIHPIPQTKLNQLRDAIFLDKQRSMLKTFETLIRAKPLHKEHILNVIKNFRHDEQQLAYPWFQVEKADRVEYYTPLLDAIELYDFIERKGGL